MPRDRDRADLLIEAGLALASERSLEAVLQRIVELAVDHHRRELRSDQRVVPGRTDPRVHHRRDHRRGTGGDRRPTDRTRDPRLVDQRGTSAAARGDRCPPDVGGVPAQSPTDAFAPRRARPRPRQGLREHLRDREAGRRRVLASTTSASLQVLATQAGVAVENARLYEDMIRAQDEVRRLEVLDDRERIAKELHDGVIQSLFAVGMSLQGAAALAQDEGITDPDRGSGRGHRRRDPGPAQLHLRPAAGDLGRPPAGSGVA